MKATLLPKQAGLLLRALTTEYKIYVFPAWTSKKLAAIEDRESGTLYIGLSEELWFDLRREHLYSTGRDIEGVDVARLPRHQQTAEIELGRFPKPAHDEVSPLESPAMEIVTLKEPAP